MKRPVDLGTFEGEGLQRCGHARELPPSLLTRADWIEAFTASGLVFALSSLGGLLIAEGVLRLMDFGLAHGWMLP